MREHAGQPAAPGIALGRLHVPGTAAASARSAGTPAEEQAALTAAIGQALAELAALAAQAAGEAADVLEFQTELLGDPALREPADALIAQGAAADTAWAEALAAQIDTYAEAEDAYFRARAADLRDLRDRVLRHLLGAAAERLPSGAIVLMDDITPSLFLETDWRGGGIALAAGSAASHVAMLARSRGVPMVVGLGAITADGHAEAALDGGAGKLWLDPDDVTRATLSARAPKQHDPTLLRAPAVTARGLRVATHINVADPAELDGLDPAICDGIGLVRTELLFRAGPPDEDVQYAVYRRIVEWAAGRPVTIRTLDAGADKPVPGVSLPAESNPFLGVRGIRLSLARPDLFRVQLRALARAAAHGPLKIMLPMVTMPAELEAARAMLTAAAAGLPARLPPLGIMVEVPAAALTIADFDAAFFSIGSNDLVQYVTASARDIGAVAPLANPRHPAVLRLIAEVAAHGARTGREVGLCGDAAGDPALTHMLLDAGLRSLSMAPNALAGVKAAIAAYQGETP